MNNSKILPNINLNKLGHAQNIDYLYKKQNKKSKISQTQLVQNLKCFFVSFPSSSTSWLASFTQFIQVSS
jgi:hypothetical protein